MPSCRIRCLKCREIFVSPMQFGNAEAFFTSVLVGNGAECPKCGKSTGCNKENMIFGAGDEGFAGYET